MNSRRPSVPIDVDPTTGVWSTDGLPMIYMPRHFFVNNHRAVEQALGVQTYARNLYDAGYKSAWEWCEAESATHGLQGLDVFRHYMNRISQRGWGRFTVEDIDEQTGLTRVRLDHSVFVYQSGPAAGRKVCYMFAGWLPGALEWARHDWHLTCEEVQCAAEGGHDHCLLVAKPCA